MIKFIVDILGIIGGILVTADIVGSARLTSWEDNLRRLPSRLYQTPKRIIVTANNSHTQSRNKIVNWIQSNFGIKKTLRIDAYYIFITAVIVFHVFSISTVCILGLYKNIIIITQHDHVDLSIFIEIAYLVFFPAISISVFFVLTELTAKIISIAINSAVITMIGLIYGICIGFIIFYTILFYSLLWAALRIYVALDNIIIKTKLQSTIRTIGLFLTVLSAILHIIIPT